MGKNILVTGGASGIGLAMSRLFVAAGHRVCVADIDVPGLHRISSELRCRSIRLDVRDGAQWADAVAFAAADDGLDVAVNCAGIEGTVELLANQEDDALENLMAVNSLGMLLGLKYELRQMVRQGHGVICSVASMLGLRGQARWAGYCAAKHAVVGATRAAALEVAQLGIRVNAVAPGLVATPLLARANGGDPRRGVANVPMRDLAQPEDVARAIAWLCDDEACYVTGRIFSMDGGSTAQVCTTPDIDLAQFRC